MKVCFCFLLNAFNNLNCTLRTDIDIDIDIDSRASFVKVQIFFVKQMGFFGQIDRDTEISQTKSRSKFVAFKRENV